MYDDVLRWMADPFLLYPMILIGSFVGLCFATGIFLNIFLKEILIFSFFY